jgi:hypothetical protein
MPLTLLFMQDDRTFNHTASTAIHLRSDSFTSSAGLGRHSLSTIHDDLAKDQEAMKLTDPCG